MSTEATERKKNKRRHPPCVKKSMSPIRESVKAATAVKIFPFWILSTFVNLRENIEPSKFAIKKIELNNCQVIKTC